MGKNLMWKFLEFTFYDIYFLNYTLYLDLYVCWHASFSYVLFLVVIFRLSSFMGEAMSQLLTFCLFLADAVRQTLFCWVVHLFNFLYVLMFVCLCSSFFTVVCRSVFYKPFFTYVHLLIHRLLSSCIQKDSLKK